MVLAGCASRPAMTPPSASERACLTFYENVDRLVDEEGVRDGAPPPVRGYPFLRQDRELASRALASRDSVLWELHMLDRQARRWELANLGAQSRRVLADKVPEGEGVADALERCGERLLAAVRRAAEPDGQTLSALAAPSDEYIGWHRVVGVYPISRWFIRAGVAGWQRGVRGEFSPDAPAQPAALRYQPGGGETTADPLAVAGVLANVPRDDLGRAVLSAGERAFLLAAYAPVIEMERDAPHNRIGTPTWLDDGLPGVLIDRPRVYHYIDHAQLGAGGLLRLNYVFWFSARPRDHFLDLLGGRLDGLTVRVTLSEDGLPLLLETMHNCGCYHQHYPFDGLEPLSRPAYAEPPLLLPAPPRPEGAQRLALRLEDGSHYVQAVYLTEAVDGDGEEYLLEDYDRLRSLARGTGDPGRRSLFASDGLVPGTERGERWIFWVSGVPEPGAMRQRGRHATAFVGRRHFDDPDLLHRIYHRPGNDRTE